MQIVVFSHKEIWDSSSSLSGYSTIGGFPFQMQTLSELFDDMHLIVLRRETHPLKSTRPLTGKSLKVIALPEPSGRNFRRKISLLSWLPRYFSLLWNEIRFSDAVHAPIPGDIGIIGLLVALIQKKPLFVRHCGTWGNRTTLADRFLDWLLPRIAGGRNVVMATGGGDAPPCPQNPNIEWIFSTTLTEAEWQILPQAKPWNQGEPLRLVTVGRLSAGKNAAAILRAMLILQNQCPEICLDILGDGSERSDLMDLADSLNLSSRVTFHGNVPHEGVMNILSQSNIFVFPTKTKEGFPKAVLEAMASGLPVIATGVSVIPHLLSDGAGIVLGAPVPEQVASAILDLIAAPDQMRTMGAKARQVSQQYTLENWQALIGQRLRAAWGPLKEGEG